MPCIARGGSRGEQRAGESCRSNVFADLGYTDPQTHKLKAQIVSEIADIIVGHKPTQKAAGAVMGMSQPDVSQMLNGRFCEHSVERQMGFVTLV